MELRKSVQQFIDTQNNRDSKSFVECFTPSAIVHDEGKTYQGKTEILHWIEESNQKYQTVTKPIQYDESGSNGILTAEVSGTFPGSPAVLRFHFGLKDGLIDSLKTTG